MYIYIYIYIYIHVYTYVYILTIIRQLLMAHRKQTMAFHPASHFQHPPIQNLHHPGLSVLKLTVRMVHLRLAITHRPKSDQQFTFLNFTRNKQSNYMSQVKCRPRSRTVIDFCGSLRRRLLKRWQNPRMNMQLEDSLRGSSVKIAAMQRRLGRPLRKDDTHTSRSVYVIYIYIYMYTHTYT